MKTLTLAEATYAVGRLVYTHPRHAVVLMEPKEVVLEYSPTPTTPALPVVVFEVANG